jgi:hypothetical protein
VDGQTHPSSFRGWLGHAARSVHFKISSWLVRMSHFPPTMEHSDLRLGTNQLCYPTPFPHLHIDRHISTNMNPMFVPIPVLSGAPSCPLIDNLVALTGRPSSGNSYENLELFDWQPHRGREQMALFMQGHEPGLSLWNLPLSYQHAYPDAAPEGRSIPY